MQLTINTEQPLTAQEKRILQTLLDSVEPDFPTQSERQEKPARKKPGPKPKPKPEETAPEPEPEAEDTAPEPEPEAEDTAPEPEAEEPTLDDAVARATKLVSEGEATKVRDALSKTGAKRVSELSSKKDIKTFVEALNE